jgi:DNA-binding LytR/AlgR family response regulator
MIRCIVVDDEPIARGGMAEHISQVPFLHLSATCKNALEASSALQEIDVDLIFLDIQMPQINGIDFVKTLSHPPLVVFTTAYPQYALDGFELDVLDYLLKPVSFNRFLKAAHKAQDYIKRMTVQTDDYFFLKVNQRLEKIKTADVLYVEGMSNYVVVHTAGKKYVAYLTFKGIQEQLSQQHFIRVHKSYLVNMASVDAVDGMEILIGKMKIPIGKAFREDVIKAVDTRLFKR